MIKQTREASPPSGVAAIYVVRLTEGQRPSAREAAKPQSRSEILDYEISHHLAHVFDQQWISYTMT
jgi:hypothetical protein